MQQGEPKRVIVVGAGPTGLALALALGKQGVPVTVLEAEPALTHDLRAGSYHPPTVEMLTELGVGEALHAAGIKVPRWQIRDRREGVIADFDLGLLADETPYPYRLHLEQHRLTPILLEEINRAAPGVETRFSAPVARVEQDSDGVRVILESGETLEAAFCVGCDGARSVVRQSTGVEFEGFTWPERFLVASTTHDLGQYGFSGAGYVADPEHWCAVFHVPDEGPPGLWRVAYGIGPEEEEEEVLRPEAVQARLRLIFDHIPLPAEPLELKYASIYRVHQRVAAQFYKGRIALAGDAAHINNPLGGLGLNGSIHDAVFLAEKLVPLCREGGDHESAFAHYDRQRRPINIKAVQAMSIRNKKLLEERDETVRRERLDEMAAIAGDPARAKAHLMNTSMINSVREARATA